MDTPNHVSVQGSERREVNDANSFAVGGQQRFNNRDERCFRLAGPGGGNNQLIGATPKEFERLCLERVGSAESRAS